MMLSHVAIFQSKKVRLNNVSNLLDKHVLTIRKNKTAYDTIPSVLEFFKGSILMENRIMYTCIYIYITTSLKKKREKKKVEKCQGRR